MRKSIFDKVVQSLEQTKQHNGNIMVKPEVILWPDPESQWSSVISILQETFPALLIYGVYDLSKMQGPAIWLKCMVAQTLPEANWASTETPIIYLPGISKNDLKNVQNAGLDFQPLIEYQYTGTIFTQENGKEWTILAFLQNQINGLGIKVAQDTATKDALKKALASIFKDADVLHNKAIIDAEYLQNQLFPDIIPNILKWICKGDVALKAMEDGKKEIFYNLCQSQYEFEPNQKNIIEIVAKLGSQRNAWKYVWQHYANAPKKYPEIQEYLRAAKPELLAFPEESWPQINEANEDELHKSLQSVAKLQLKDAISKLKIIENQHGYRRGWVWAELGQAPLANALLYLKEMSEIAIKPYPFSSISELKQYYIEEGYRIDQTMRKSLAAVKSEKDKEVIKSIINSIYKPWLETITIRFQSLVEKDTAIFTSQTAQIATETYILFVDAFRFELAEEFVEILKNKKYKVDIQANWSAIPSLTPTAKPNVSPIAIDINTESKITEFRPQLNSGKDLLTPVFREALTLNNFTLVTHANDIKVGQKHWQEIGDIDTKGHEEQAEMVRRIDDLFEQVMEIIEIAFQKGIKKIQIVTDHGWLLLPGGLPKEELNKDLTATRWGRCATIKDGAKTDLMHLPWRWNKSIFIAYATGINFFKKNEEYAHGGISIHECLIPTLLIENPNESKVVGKIKSIKWVNLKCEINTEATPDGYIVDIRTKYNDGNTSIVLSSRKAIKDNRIVLMVDDGAESQAAVIVLMDENEVILDKKTTTVAD